MISLSLFRPAPPQSGPGSSDQLFRGAKVLSFSMIWSFMKARPSKPVLRVPPLAEKKPGWLIQRSFCSTRTLPPVPSLVRTSSSSGISLTSTSVNFFPWSKASSTILSARSSRGLTPPPPVARAIAPIVQLFISSLDKFLVMFVHLTCFYTNKKGGMVGATSWLSRRGRNPGRCRSAWG